MRPIKRLKLSIHLTHLFKTYSFHLDNKVIISYKLPASLPLYYVSKDSALNQQICVCFQHQRRQFCIYCGTQMTKKYTEDLEWVCVDMQHTILCCILSFCVLMCCIKWCPRCVFLC